MMNKFMTSLLRYAEQKDGKRERSLSNPILNEPLFIVICLLSLFSYTALAQQVEYSDIVTLNLKKEFNTQKEWRVTASQPEGDISPDEDVRTGDVSAKLCFRVVGSDKQEECTFIMSTLPNGGMTYHYQTVKNLSVISSPHLIQFIAEYSGGGSGTLHQVSFWRYDSNIDSFAQAGLVTLTEQSEYKLLGKDMLITADAYWGEGETHFSPHHFTITAYQYSPSVGYKKSFSYLSAAKYPSLDDVDKVDVISYEMAVIKKRLSDVR